MLKTGLYIVLLLTTTVRFTDIVYVLAKDSTNLPAAVLVVTTAMVLYGIVLAVKRFFGPVRVKQYMTFFLVQSIMIGFNITYTAVACPLQITGAETLIVGTFLDLLVNAGLLYLSLRQMRRGFIPGRHYN